MYDEVKGDSIAEEACFFHSKSMLGAYPEVGLNDKGYCSPSFL